MTDFREDKNRKDNTGSTGRHQNSISMTGKKPDEIFLELVSGEPDDLPPDFFNNKI